VVVTALVDRFFGGEPTDELLAAVHLTPAKPGARLDWTWDELVLACDLLPVNGWHELPVTDQHVLDLSRLLRLLPIHPVEKRGPRFRSPDSVRRKNGRHRHAAPRLPVPGRPAPRGRQHAARS
jgi:5-methylcytosine-specific restriction protein A